MTRAQLMQGLNEIVTLTHDCVDSGGKFRLWTVVMCVTTPMTPEEIMCDHEFLSHDLLHFKAEEGVVVYTMRDMQINANIAIPRSAEDESKLVDLFLMGLQKLLCVTINISPLLSHVHSITAMPRSILFRKRRFYCVTTELSKIHYDHEAQKLTMGEASVAVLRTIDPVDIIHYRPLTTAQKSDNPATLYWHRFDDVIVVIRNEVRALLAPVDLPPVLEAPPDLNIVTDPALRDFIHSFMIPNDSPLLMEMCKRIVCNHSIPSHIRNFLFGFVSTRVGVDDELIALVGDAFFADEKARENDVINIICHIYICMRKQNEGLPFDAIDVTRAMEIIVERSSPTWESWLDSSTFFVDMIISMTAAVAIKVATRHPRFARSMDRVLHNRKQWHREDENKAAWLVSNGLASAETEQRYVFLCEKVNSEASKMFDTPKMTQSKKKSKRRPPARPVATPPPTVKSTPPTSIVLPDHMAAVERLCQRYGFEATLVGSGIFFAASDIDIVIRVADAISLSDAYERVVEITGWTLTRTPTGESVAVIHGEWEGVPVDAQVWRGDPLASSAEAETHRAVRLSTRLRSLVPHRSRDVYVLHRWAEGAGVKGHRLCRLPGIAVTCLALMTPSPAMDDDDDDMSLLRMLRSLRQVLDESQTIRFDDDGECSVVSGTLRVVIDGRDVATRMTRLTTMHLKRVVECAIEGRQPPPMVRCLVLEPRDESVVARQLAKIASRLDGHPCFDALRFDATSGRIEVWTQLNASAPASVYGLRVTDRLWTRCDADGAVDRVEVERDGRRFILQHTPLSAGIPTVPRADLSRVDECVFVCGVVLPNAASITRDVSSQFGEDWMCV